MNISSKPTIWLDRSGSALAPEGCAVISTEIEFLRHALDTASMLVRGETLCRWAESYYRGRGIGCVTLRSPAEDLASCCPGLSIEQARLVIGDLGVGHYQDLPKPVGILDVLQGLYPGGPWESTVSRSHAARWLVWLGEADVPDHVEPLIIAQTEQWRTLCTGSEKVAYDAASPARARQDLACWLGLETREDFDRLGAFPIPVPPAWLEQARDLWSSEILQDGDGCLRRLKGHALPRQLLEVAALETCKYYVHHAAELSQGVVRLLSEYLPSSQVQRLRALLPPDDPGECPETIEAILGWYTDSYLPYRNWESEHGDEKAHERVRFVARAFAEWYLRFYPVALSGGRGKELMAISRASGLHADDTAFVTLWVVADGLNYEDAEELVRNTERACSRLSTSELRVVLSPIPGITEFAKPALLRGLPPSEAGPDGSLGLPSDWVMLSESKDPSECVRAAEIGSVFVWSLLEPDRTYHKRNDRATIRKNVEGQLQILASKIADAAEAVPVDLQLRIIITTDHGRMLSATVRQAEVPSGMVSHGRAAWGPSGLAFSESGVEFAEDIAYLCRHRFGLSEDCAVVVGDVAFKTKDDKGGQEEFPHGGLYPEEVLIPWVEMVRDRVLPKVKCHLHGKARAGAIGVLVGTVENLSDVPLALVSVKIEFGGQDVRNLLLDGGIAPRAPEPLEKALERWPTGHQASNAQGTLVLRLPTGIEFESEIELSLESEELYSRDTLLEDL